jgi:phage host-nuclease inhibitor protein Gam
MKSAYERAMERFGQVRPAVKLSTEQKHQLAELDSLYAAKIAEREITFQSAIAKAGDDYDKIQSLKQELQAIRKDLQAELEVKKQEIRGGQD